MNLKCMVLNAENLFLLSDQPITDEHLAMSEQDWQKISRSTQPNKELRKLLALAELIQVEKPRVVALCEVGGLESLVNFNRLFLSSRYSVALIEGNSDRGIDVGYLVDTQGLFYFNLLTHRNRNIDLTYEHELPPAVPYRFARDVAELHLFQNKQDLPFAIFLMVHLKSRLDPDGIDPNGFTRRRAEAKTLLRIYQEIELKFEGKVPIIVAGDFNGIAARPTPDEEFSELYEQTLLEDILHLGRVPLVERATFVTISRGQRPDLRQIDYAFLNATAQTHLDANTAKVIRYKNPLGRDLPQTLEEKMLQPSDHFPLVFLLKNLLPNRN